MPAMDVVDYKDFGDDMQYVEVELDPGEAALAEAGAMMYMEDGAFQPTVNYDIRYIGKIKTALFGGEGLFFATLRGPGRVWLQSLRLSRMANRIIAAVRGLIGRSREEGSILGSWSGILNGE